MGLPALLQSADREDLRPGLDSLWASLAFQIVGFGMLSRASRALNPLASIAGCISKSRFNVQGFRSRRGRLKDTRSRALASERHELSPLVRFRREALQTQAQSREGRHSEDSCSIGGFCKSQGCGCFGHEEPPKSRFSGLPSGLGHSEAARTRAVQQLRFMRAAL